MSAVLRTAGRAAGVALVALALVLPGGATADVAKRPGAAATKRPPAGAKIRSVIRQTGARLRVRPRSGRPFRRARSRSALVLPAAPSASRSGPAAPTGSPEPSDEESQPQAAESESPTGPIDLPGTGIALDPLAPGDEEQELQVEQPNANLTPYFLETSGWFGSGFTNSDGSSRASVTVGADRVLVMSDLADRVYMYDTRSLAGLGSYSTGFSSSRNLSYYRGQIFVLGGTSTSTSSVRVFDLSGALLRQLALKAPLAAQAYTGLDVAWGELWVSTPSLETSVGDIAGQEVAVFDALTGAFKGMGRQPLTDKDPDEPRRFWWDFALSPELGGGISDRRFFARGPSPLPGFGVDNAVACTGRALFGCAANNQRGIDAVWGMRWFLELNSPVVSDYDRKVTEYSIERRKAVSLPTLGLATDYPGHYLSFRRSWQPRQAQLNTARTLTDVVYSHRKARIDWEGPLTKSDWVRGQQCLTYVVSDADIFVIGDRGERWYEPARGFQSISLWVDGQHAETKTMQSGTFCRDTTAYANRPAPGAQPHTIELRATLEGGRVVTTTNGDLRIDNAPPSGRLVEPELNVRGSVMFEGLMDDVHSGPGSWTFEVLPAGSSTWQRPCAADTTPTDGRYGCAWDTLNGSYPDGIYQVRALMTDVAGNTAYTVTVGEVEVSNAPPTDDTVVHDTTGEMTASTDGEPETANEPGVPSNETPDDEEILGPEEQFQASCAADDPSIETLEPVYGAPRGGDPGGYPLPELALTEFLAMPPVPKIPPVNFSAAETGPGYVVFTAIDQGSIQAFAVVEDWGDGWLTSVLEFCSRYPLSFDPAAIGPPTFGRNR